ncbi:MAG: hypothetical protein JWL61_2330 [Gemmatimonadetes bacterium]|nr:hypothetical protein [Gemmatimonadota bacterium]
MRTAFSALLLPFAAWLGVLQVVAARSANIEDTARFVGLASVLGTVTVLVYRLGIWRQEMENTKHNVGAEVKSHREESTANFERLERRLEAIDHMITIVSEQQTHTMRWRTRTDRRLNQLEEDGTEQTR